MVWTLRCTSKQRYARDLMPLSDKCCHSYLERYVHSFIRDALIWCWMVIIWVFLICANSKPFLNMCYFDFWNAKSIWLLLYDFTRFESKNGTKEFSQWKFVLGVFWKCPLVLHRVRKIICWEKREDCNGLIIYDKICIV